jgi:hypothetical protein
MSFTKLSHKDAFAVWHRAQNKLFYSIMQPGYRILDTRDHGGCGTPQVVGFNPEIARKLQKFP